MGKNCLKQILTNINKVYNVGEKINSLKNKNKSSVKISSIYFIVLFGFMIQIKSFNRFNRLERLLKRNRFKKLLPKKTKMPCIHSIRRSLIDFDLDALKDFHNHIVKTAIQNKVFRNGTIDGLKVVAIDGVELFDSIKKCCDKCLRRVDMLKTMHFTN